MTRPWWETHPRKYWTAEDRRAARKAGVLPKLPSDNVDPALKLLAENSPKLTSVGGLYDKPNREGERRRKVNAALEKFGLRRPDTW